MFGRFLRWHTIYTFLGALAPFPDAKITLHSSLAFSYIGTITARQLSSVHQPNFAMCNKERNCGTFAPRLCHLYLAGRPSHWASAHILVCVYFVLYISFDWWMHAFVVLGLVFSMPSQEIGSAKRLWNDLFCVKWDLKPQLSQSIKCRLNLVVLENRVLNVCLSVREFLIVSLISLPPTEVDPEWGH